LDDDDDDDDEIADRERSEKLEVGSKCRLCNYM